MMRLARSWRIPGVLLMAVGLLMLPAAPVSGTATGCGHEPEAMMVHDAACCGVEDVAVADASCDCCMDSERSPLSSGCAICGTCACSATLAVGALALTEGPTCAGPAERPHLFQAPAPERAESFGAAPLVPPPRYV